MARCTNCGKYFLVDNPWTDPTLKCKDCLPSQVSKYYAGGAVAKIDAAAIGREVFQQPRPENLKSREFNYDARTGNIMIKEEYHKE